ncbi:MAG: hypothetical protein KDB03_21630 [Planctomycetales bacterium]|nr:hypothetical protein [Planctomycetales bacterium]
MNDIVFPLARSQSSITTSRLVYRRYRLVLIFAILVVVMALPLRGQDPNGEPSVVHVGAYVNDIQALDLREHSYAIDLYVWFRWNNSDISPAESAEFVNPNELWGHINEPQYETPLELPNGEFYQVIRVQGRFSHKFLFNSFPYDRQLLLVEFEDSVNEINRMVYVADAEPLAMNPRLLLPGFRIATPELGIESFAYPTTFGDPRRSEPNTYSRVRIAIPIRRPIWTSSLKLLLPVLCVVFGASLMLRLKVTLIDARLGVGITSLLTIVAIQLAANETMPNVDYLVLLDKIHLAAYAYVLICLGIVLRTHRLVDSGQVDLAERFQFRGYWFTNLLFLSVVACLVAVAIFQG